MGNRNSNIFVAVSGGSDSMYLLFYLKDKYKNREIHALHVNYNFRPESIRETEMIKEYCKYNDVKFISLNVTDEIKKAYKINNLENLARNIRYDFFRKVLEKEDNPVIYVGHHRDDFIETAIMMEDRSSDYFFYGIKKTSSYKNIKIIRPLIILWKDEILVESRKLKIPYMIDKSNFDETFSRNKIRINLALLNTKDKKKIYDYYKSINNARNHNYRKSLKIFEKWKEKNFSLIFYKNLENEIKNNIIYLYLSNQHEYMGISKNKIIGIIDFLDKNPKEGKYRLKEKTFLKILKDELHIEEE